MEGKIVECRILTVVVPPKHQLTINGLHDVISQKMALFVWNVV
jgi:hypothetical protein